MKPPFQLITEERARQIAAEGYTAAHDDCHSDGSLARAGECYATPAAERSMMRVAVPLNEVGPPYKMHEIPKAWPWGAEWWKPCPNDRERELVKAGALFTAEHERLKRLGFHGHAKQYEERVNVVVKEILKVRMDRLSKRAKQWLHDIAQQLNDCDASGFADHPESRAECVAAGLVDQFGGGSYIELTGEVDDLVYSQGYLANA